jgi:hypothetical protein
MGSVALVRLLILGVIYPFLNIIKDKRTVENALAKWTVVLKWAVGRQEAVVEE